MNESQLPPVASPFIETSRILDFDLSCIHCGYNLRGLRKDSLCPECGQPITHSTRGDLLKFADTAWLRKLKLGVKLKLWALVFSILAGILGAASVGLWGGAPGIQTGSLAWTCLMMGLDLYAVFLMTTLDPRMSVSEQAANLRRFIRGCFVAAFLGTCFETIGDTYASIAFFWISVPFQFVGIIGVFGLLKYLRLLAGRIPDGKLAKRTGFVMWGFPLAQAFFAIQGFVVVLLAPGLMASGAAVGVTGSTAGAAPATIPGIMLWYTPVICTLGLGALIFGLLYVSLLSRFARAFATAGAEARQFESPVRQA